MSEFLDADDETFSLNDGPVPTQIDDAADEFDAQQERAQSDAAEEIAGAFKETRKRPRKASEYERKAIGPIRALARKLAGKHSTKPDAAALLMTGPTIARSLGDLAADNPNIAKLLDLGSDTTESPTAKLTGELFTLTMQVIRNHEDALAPGAERIVVLRGGRKIRLPQWLGVRLPAMFRDMMTDDPETLAVNVFNNDKISKITADWYIAE